MPSPNINDAWFTSCLDSQEMIRPLLYQPENDINVFSCDDASGTLMVGELSVFANVLPLWIA